MEKKLLCFYFLYWISKSYFILTPHKKPTNMKMNEF